MQSSRSRSADCLNGIAYNSSDKSFVLTGKQWPSYFHVGIDMSLLETKQTKKRFSRDLFADS